MKVRERMGAGLVRLSESEWVLRDLGLGKLVFILGFFFFFFLILYIRVGFGPGMPIPGPDPNPVRVF